MQVLVISNNNSSIKQVSCKWLLVGLILLIPAKNYHYFQLQIKLSKPYPIKISPIKYHSTIMGLQGVIHLYRTSYSKPSPFGALYAKWLIKVQAALAICGFGIRSFDYSRTQKPQITRENCNFKPKLV